MSQRKGEPDPAGCPGLALQPSSALSDPGPPRPITRPGRAASVGAFRLHVHAHVVPPFPGLCLCRSGQGEPVNLYWGFRNPCFGILIYKGEHLLPSSGLRSDHTAPCSV